MSKTLAVSYFMQSHNKSEFARRELFQHGIKSSYDDKVMIFTTMHTAKTKFDNQYIQECNGLILEQNTWRPLVVPPRTLRVNINTDASNKFLHQGLYHIYKVQDGTCFNMYFYNNKWIISTARGHTMNDTKWAQSKSYQEIITDCLEKIGLTWDTFTGQLDKLNCYSFGFRHPLMQKFREGKDSPIYKLWFIQSVCVNKNDPKYLWSNDTCPIAIITTQEVYPSTVGNLRELYKKASNALHDFTDRKEVCYGYILRSANSAQTGEHSDLFIESALMRAIRRTWYENNLIDQCHRFGWHKELAILLHAYLDAQNNEMFQKLFPEFSAELLIIHNYVSGIAVAMAQKVLTPNVITNAITSNNTLVPILLQSFKDNVRFDTKNQTVESLAKIYFEYVRHPESMDLIYTNSFTYLLQSIERASLSNPTMSQLPTERASLSNPTRSQLPTERDALSNPTMSQLPTEPLLPTVVARPQTEAQLSAVVAQPPALMEMEQQPQLLMLPELQSPVSIPTPK